MDAYQMIKRDLISCFNKATPLSSTIPPKKQVRYILLTIVLLAAILWLPVKDIHINSHNEGLAIIIPAVGQEQLAPSPWAKTSPVETDGIIATNFILSPEVLNPRSGRIPVWLEEERGIYHRNIRDMFIAGRRDDITSGRQNYKGMPRAIATLAEQQETQGMLQALPAEQRQNWKSATQKQLKGSFSAEAEVISKILKNLKKL